MAHDNPAGQKAGQNSLSSIAMRHSAIDTPINIQAKFRQFSDHWSPKVIAQMNDYQFKLVKIQGEFVWHSHPDTDEVFIVLNGEMSIDFRDGRVDLKSGEMLVVPKGVEHKPAPPQNAR